MSAIRNMQTTHKSVAVLRCKVLLVGDTAVGKTAIAQMFQSAGHNFPKNYIMTSSVDLSVKTLNIPNTNIAVELYLFDCPGQSVFNQRELTSVNYENASMILLVYDVSNRESFKSCLKWYQEVTNTVPNHRLPGALIASKIDLKEGNRDAISKKEGEELADKFDLKYFECSALLPTGIEEPFKYLAEIFHKKYEEVVQRAEKLF